MVNSSHDTSPIASFGYDADGDGHSDLIQWLFDGEKSSSISRLSF